jgi:hypothetical protein
VPVRPSGKGGLERTLRRSVVKKVEMKGEAGVHYIQLEPRIYTLSLGKVA